MTGLASVLLRRREERLGKVFVVGMSVFNAMGKGEA
jgi:hypothetical protein